MLVVWVGGWVGVGGVCVCVNADCTSLACLRVRREEHVDVEPQVLCRCKRRNTKVFYTDINTKVFYTDITLVGVMSVRSFTPT